MRTERWTRMTKLKVAFRNFANAPKNTLHPLKKANHLKYLNEVAV